MTCVRSKAGARKPAPSTPAGSPSRRDPRPGRRRARLLALLPALALLCGALGLFAPAPAAAQNVPPSVPRDFTLTPGDGVLVATWTAPSNWGSHNRDGYSLRWRVKEPQGSWSTARQAGHRATTYRIHGLTNGTEYEVEIWARTSIGQTSLVSSKVTASGTPASPLPAAPTGLTVSPGDTKLDLSWTAPAGTVTGYDVHYTSAPAGSVANDADVQTVASPSPANGWVDAGHSGTAASQAISGLVNGTPYRVRVRAKNAHGAGAWAHQSGTPSAIPTVTLSVSPTTVVGGRPITVTATLSAALSGWITVNLERVAGTAHASRLLGPTSIFITAGATSGTATGRTQGGGAGAYGTYTIRIKDIAIQPGLGAVQKGSPSSVQIDITPHPPVRDLAVRGADARLELSWNAPSSGTVTGYEVHVTCAVGDMGAAPLGCRTGVADHHTQTFTDLTEGWTPVSRMGTARTQTIQGLVNGRPHRVRVRPVYSGGAKGTWAFVEGTPAPSVMPTPTNLTATAGAGKVTLSWQVSEDGPPVVQNRYQVEYGEHPNGTTTVKDTGRLFGGATPSYAITGLDPAKTYRFRVRTKKQGSFARSAWSGWVTATPLAVPTPPGAPTGLNVTGQHQTLALEWTAPAGTVTGYDVHYTYSTTVANDATGGSGNHPSSAWVAADRGTESDPPDHWQDIGNLTNGTEYRVRVRAVNAGSAGAWVFGSGTPERPGPPTNLRATPGVGKLDLTWTAATGSIGGYQLEYTSAAAADVAWGAAEAFGSDPARGWLRWEATPSHTHTSAAMTGLANGVTYRLRLRAHYGTNVTPWAFAQGTTLKSDDATLSALAVTALNQEMSTSFESLDIGTFAAATTEYTARVVQPTGHVKLYATVNDANASVKIGRRGGTLTAPGVQATVYTLDLGKNIFQVQVTAEDGTTTEDYYVIIDRNAVPTNLCAKAGGAFPHTGVDADVRPALRGTPVIALSAGNPDGSQFGNIVYQVKEAAAAWPARKLTHDVPASAQTDDVAFTPQGCTGSTFVVAGLTPGGEYDVRAHLTDALNDPVPESATAARVTVWDVPGAPTSVAAAAGSDTTLNATWTAPAATGGTGATITGHKVRWRVKDTQGHTAGDQPGAWSAAAGVDADSLTGHAITGLASGTAYEVEVRALNGIDPGGAWSAAAEGETALPAGVSWQASLRVKGIGTGVLGCDNNNGAANRCSTGTTLTDDDFSVGGRAYHVTRIRYLSTGALAVTLDRGPNAALLALDLCVGGSAFSLTGQSSSTLTWAGANLGWSAGDTVALRLAASCAAPTTDPPAAPAGLSVAPGDARLDFTWTAPAGTVTGYDVHYTSADAGSVANDAAVQTGASPSPADGWVDAGHTGTEAAQAISGLANGTPYRVRVRARNAHGAGAWAHAAGTPALQQDPPTNLVVTPGDRQLAVTWTAPSNFNDIFGYELDFTSAAAADVADDASADASDPAAGWVGTKDVPNFRDTSYTITSRDATLVNGTPYRVRLRTIAPESPYAFATGTPEAAPVRPRPPGPVGGTVWSAVLTVSDAYLEFPGLFLGCDDSAVLAQNAQGETPPNPAAFCAPSGALTDDDFTYGGETNSIFTVLYGNSILVLGFRKTIPERHRNSLSLVLRVGGRMQKLHLAAGELDDTGHADDSKLDFRDLTVPNWTVGRKVALSLERFTLGAVGVNGHDRSLSVFWKAAAGDVLGYDVHYTASATVAGGAPAGADAATGWVAAPEGTGQPGANGLVVQQIRDLPNGTPYRVRVRPRYAAGDPGWAFAAGRPRYEAPRELTASGDYLTGISFNDGVRDLPIEPNAANTVGFGDAVETYQVHVPPGVERVTVTPTWTSTDVVRALGEVTNFTDQFRHGSPGWRRGDSGVGKSILLRQGHGNGSTKFRIWVDLPDPQPGKTYTFYLTHNHSWRSADARLNQLSMRVEDMGASEGETGVFRRVDFDRAFARGEADPPAYRARVAHDVTRVLLEARASHPSARIRVNGGSRYTPVVLDEGENVIEVVVAAEDRRYLRTYTVEVTREGAPRERAAGPLRASFEGAPAEHDGAASFALNVRFSEALGEGGVAPAAASFDVRGGTVKRVRRLEPGLWRVRIVPDSWRDVAVTLAGGRACDAKGAVCAAGGKALSNTATAQIAGPVRIRLEGGTVREGRDESLGFKVTLNRAAGTQVSVDYATADGTAVAGEDFMAVSGTLRFAPGETAKTVAVPILDDAIDEGKERFVLRLSNPQGAYLRKIHREAVGVIKNDDPLQRMWLSRFGRTVGSQVTDAVSERLGGGLAPGVHATLVGQPFDLSKTDDGRALAETLTGLARAFGAPAANDDPGPGAPGSGPGQAGAGPFARHGLAGRWDDRAAATAAPARSMTGRELLLGSAFHLASGGERAGPALAAWGRVAQGRFDGEEDAGGGTTRVAGEVLTGTLGADADFGRLLAGVAVSLSEGDGTFDSPGADAGGKGSIESTMTTVSPYARFNVTERVSAWGLAGWGTGDMTIRFDDGPRAPVRTDLSMQLGAIGARGALLTQDEAGGMDLALRADAFFVRMESEKAANSAETTADASRVRLVLEGGRAFAVGGGATVRPSLELGVRHDGGDAETGSGLEVGGGIAWSDPASGLGIEVRARMLAAHADSDYEEWGASARLDPGERGRGLSFSLSPTIGATSSAAERLWGAQDARGLAPGGGAFEAARGLTAEAGFGLALFGDRFTGTPNVGFGLSDGGARDWRLGWRLTSAVPGDPGFEVSLDATRREPANDNAVEHGVMLRSLIRW